MKTCFRSTLILYKSKECKFRKRQTNSIVEVKIHDISYHKSFTFRYICLIIKDSGEIDGDVNLKIQASWLK
ncbi:hypothetical protein Lal_00037571 [Lupinus albus]|nr:hypothetical protein Lal_00037571 [Lupinus albus]